MKTFLHAAAAAIILIVLFVSGCNKLGEKNNSSSDSQNVKTTGNKSDSVSPPAFYYEPDTCAIYGLLNKESFYGPPGYGENPKKDAKEYCYVLKLKVPIDVKPREGSDKNFDIQQNKVQKIQIFSNDKSVNDFLEGRIGDNVMVRGRLLGASTGHHHTPVIMEVFEYKYYGQ
ncbi:MAG: DUF4431 domain-containing protein [Ignavibacteria bacterium]